MSNPQWAVRLESETIERLNALIDSKYVGDRQKFIDTVLETLGAVKHPEIDRIVQGVMRFNKAQEISADRVLINYQIVFNLMGNTSQVNILKYLKENVDLLEAHHKEMGLGDANKSWNATHRLKYTRTSDKDNNELAKLARVEQLKADLKPYIEVCA